MYSQAAQKSPAPGPFYIKQARMEQESGDLTAALNAARQGAALLPQDPDALTLYGTLAAKRQKFAEALSALRSAHALKPDDPVPLLTLVTTEMDMSNMQDAERDLTPYLQTHPQDALACYLMAVIFNQKQRTPANRAQTLRYAQRALAGMPQDAHVYTLLGQLYLEMNRPAEALRTYQAGIRVAPNNAGILRGLVDGFTRVKDTAAAA